MAKAKAGLPDGFDLKVGKSELVAAPARLPGYLDRNFVRPPVEEVNVRTEIVAPGPVNRIPQVDLPIKHEPRHVVSNTEERPLFADNTVKKPRERLQINFSVDAKEKVMELASIVARQGRQKDINFNDIIEACIVALHDCRMDLNVGELPIRGRWGTPTAKSFRTALAQAIKQCLVTHDAKSKDSSRRVAIR